MTDKVQKIREEVEMVVSRRLNLLNGDYFDLNKEVDGFTNEIMDIVDSLQEEPVSEELEEAARSYSNNLDNICGSIGEQTKNAFKNGAKWQKAKDQEIIETAIHHAYHNGRLEMKEQMMAKAIDAHCFGFQGAALFSFRLPASNYLVGSKVKVIVIKED